MPLTQKAIDAAKPGPKPIRMFDGQGLYLEVSPSGARLWRLKYRFLGKEKRLALGRFPEVSLKQARTKAFEARSTIAAGHDPSEVRRLQRRQAMAIAADSFELVARDWFQRHLATKAKGHREKVERRLERDVFRYIGKRPIATLTAPDILEVLRRIERRGALETAHRALQNIGQVIRFGIATGRATADPTPALRGALAPVTHKHMAAPAQDPQAVGELLRMLDAFKGGPVVATAVRLLPLLFCRPGELRTMRWEEVDLDGAQWTYRVSKTGTEQITPLPLQAVALLRELHPMTGHLLGGWVFPGGRSPLTPMSDAAINAAYRRLGIDTQNELTGHGWRAVARTMLHEHLQFPVEVIEHQLAHAVPDALGRAYNRTRFLEKRREMMQVWADHLDELRLRRIPLAEAA